MKIIHVIHSCSPGGAEIYIKNLLIFMKKVCPENIYQLWVIYRANDLHNGEEQAIKFEDKFVDELLKHDIEVKFIGKQRGFLNRLNMMRRINKLYSSNKPDIIHCHLEIVTFHMISSLLFRKVIIIETIHNIKINRPNLHKYFLNYKIKKYVSIANSVSKVIKEDIGVSNEKIEKIYNGIDIEKFSFDRNDFNNSKSKRIVAIGRLTKQKNHLLLLKSFEKLIKKCKENNIDIPILDIYGQGELENELKSYVETKGIENITFKGITNNISDVLNNNDIYVMSSIYEGFSISLIEAVASGIAIVCTDVGGNSEIIENNKTGILVESEDIQMLTDSIYELIINNNKRKNFYTSCNLIKNKFSIDECANNHLNMYKEYR